MFSTVAKREFLWQELSQGNVFESRKANCFLALKVEAKLARSAFFSVVCASLLCYCSRSNEGKTWPHSQAQQRPCEPGSASLVEILGHVAEKYWTLIVGNLLASLLETAVLASSLHTWMPCGSEGSWALNYLNNRFRPVSMQGTLSPVLFTQGFCASSLKS